MFNIFIDLTKSIINYIPHINKSGFTSSSYPYGITHFSRRHSSGEKETGNPFNRKIKYDPFSLACLARLPEIIQTLIPKHGQDLIKAYWADPYLPALHAMEFETPVFEIPQLPESCMEKYNKFVELGYLEAA